AAEKWFAERGLEVNEESRALLPDGGTKLVYFKREFAGFAVHLCRE
ncbi:MAG: VOC family protein, partial [Collinsella sp.]|nr:VOC family protein [Collinsella sp.]